MYYLQSRYFNPQWCQFINADTNLDTQTSIIGTNIFAYCDNNPVMGVDPSGKLKEEDKIAITALVILFFNTILSIIIAGIAGATTLFIESFSVKRDEFGVYHIEQKITIGGTSFIDVDSRMGTLQAWTNYKNEFDNIRYRFAEEACDILSKPSIDGGYGYMVDSLSRYLTGLSYSRNKLDATNDLINTIIRFQSNPTQYTYLLVMDKIKKFDSLNSKHSVSLLTK